MCTKKYATVDQNTSLNSQNKQIINCKGQADNFKR